jgi:hypothetical protein
MFERISRAAEKAATGIGQSRRGFLESLGEGALVLTGLLVATARTAKAGNQHGWACTYSCPGTCGNIKICSSGMSYCFAEQDSSCGTCRFSGRQRDHRCPP